MLSNGAMENACCVEILHFAEDDTRAGLRNREQNKYTLLDDVAGAEVARVEGFAPGEAFVLAVIETDAVFAQFPAEVDVLIVDDSGKIEQADIEIFDDATGFQDAVQGGL